MKISEIAEACKEKGWTEYTTSLGPTVAVIRRGIDVPAAKEGLPRFTLAELRVMSGASRHVTMELVPVIHLVKRVFGPETEVASIAESKEPIPGPAG